MQMKMVQHCLGPGMKHTDESGLALEPPLGISGKYFDHLINRREQQVQQESHIAQDDRVQVMGKRKHQVIICSGQHLGLTIDQPLFLGDRLALGTMPVPAGVVGILLVVTMRAKFNMTAQSGCPAGNDLIHNLYLGVGCAVGV